MSDFGRISGTTQLVGLLGTPVSQSQSPAMHNASFEKLGIDATYMAFDTTPEKLETVVPAMKMMGMAGCNVTMPCKTKILPYLDELTDAARLMGAVNTVVIKDGKATGHNTDGAGFMKNLCEHGFEPKGKHMVLVGAGGAGSAVFTQAALDGVAKIDVFNRRDEFFEPGKERAAKVAAETGADVTFTDLADTEALKAACAAADVIVNASKVGMEPLDDQSLIPVDFIPEGVYVCDTVYHPHETKLILEAKAKGNPTVPGLGMMLWQGAIAEKIWFDCDMDIDFMKEFLFG